MDLSNLKTKSGAGRAFYSPRRLPALWAESAHIGAKCGAVSTAYWANSANLFSAIGGAFGAVHELTQAATYETLVNITGSGWLGWILSATYDANDATHTQYIRLTVDGQTYEFSKAFTEPASAVGYRAVLGAAIPARAAVANNAGEYSVMGGYGDSGFRYAAGRQEYIALGQTQLGMAAGLAGLRFDRSLIVEVKTSLLASTDYYRTAACDYCLEG